MYLTNPAYPLLQLLSAMSCTCQSLQPDARSRNKFAVEESMRSLHDHHNDQSSAASSHTRQAKQHCSVQLSSSGCWDECTREGTMSQTYAFWLAVAELTAPPQLTLTVMSSSMQCIHQISARAAGQC